MPANDVALFYVSLFPARTDVYSAWSEKYEGWRPVREPLTPEVALAGLTKTGPSISGYLIAPGNTTHTLALDFDEEDGYEQALAVGRAMWLGDAPAYVERSGRGAHLWACLQAPFQAKSVRQAMRWWIQLGGQDNDNPKIELRPGSDAIADDGVGHALRLPLMPHPRTGKRGRLADPRTEQPIGQTLAEILLAIEYIPETVLIDAALRYVPRPTANDIPPYLRNPRPPGRDDESSASEILRTLWGAQDARPNKAIRCPAHDDKRPSLSILKDDKRVICRSPSCILNNGDHGRGTYELRKLAPKK